MLDLRFQLFVALTQCVEFAVDLLAFGLVNGVELLLKFLVLGFQGFDVLAAHCIHLVLQGQDLRGHLGLGFGECCNLGCHLVQIGAGFRRHEHGGNGKQGEQWHEHDGGAGKGVDQAGIADIEHGSKEQGAQRDGADAKDL